jgi:hypothetical protein
LEEKVPELQVLKTTRILNKGEMAPVTSKNYKIKQLINLRRRTAPKTQ